MSNTPNNAIPYVPENTIDPAAGLNLSLQAIDALLQLSVLSVGVTTPPAAPAEGDRYIVGSGASGDWANQSGKLATWTGGVWEFRTAWYAVTGGELWVFDGLGWINTAFDVGTAAARDAIGAGDVYARGGILGTVGQSGGVPTGAIIERGSNSDGEYVKFADGTMIQTIKNLQVDISTNDLGLSEYPTPVPFVDNGFSGTWSVSATLPAGSYQAKASANMKMRASSTSGFQFGVEFETTAYSSGQTLGFNIALFGGWY